jgi:glycolate oxidase
MDTEQLLRELQEIVGKEHVTFADTLNPDDLHDESLHPTPRQPLAVVRPANTEEVSRIAKCASAYKVPVTPRGSGTGLSGAATPIEGGILISFSRMNAVLSIDAADHVVTVQPGITLRELNEALATTGLYYPVYPGELSGSLGGNVNTNAGGMRAVRHGVTRQHVLGLEIVLIDGTVLRTGGSVVKSSTGYDLTQLVIGSEGTLALVTEITLKLSPRLLHAATILVPFASLENVTTIVPTIVASGLFPSLLEYVDLAAMAGIVNAADLELGVHADVIAKTAAYLIILLETRTQAQLDLDLEDLAGLLDDAGALDVYVLPDHAAASLIEARERLFWVSKAAGANDILDIVVPRSKVPAFMGTVQALAEQHGAYIGGCGHVGDGNIHLSVFQPDEDKRHKLLHALFGAGSALGGAISGEHGIGRDKQNAFLTFSDPQSLALQRSIKSVFDPHQLLNPYRLLDERPLP